MPPQQLADFHASETRLARSPLLVMPVGLEDKPTFGVPVIKTGESVSVTFAILDQRPQIMGVVAADMSEMYRVFSDTEDDMLMSRLKIQCVALHASFLRTLHTVGLAKSLRAVNFLQPIPASTYDRQLVNTLARFPFEARRLNELLKWLRTTRNAFCHGEPWNGNPYALASRIDTVVALVSAITEALELWGQESDHFHQEDLSASL